MITCIYVLACFQFFESKLSHKHQLVNAHIDQQYL